MNNGMKTFLCTDMTDWQLGFLLQSIKVVYVATLKNKTTTEYHKELEMKMVSDRLCQ